MAGDTNAFGVSYGSKNYAGRTYAAMTREQWNTYLAQFVPLENELIEYAQDPASVGNAVTVARQNVAQSFDQQQGIQQRQLRGLGLSLNPDEQQASDRQTALSRSLAEVSAGNVAAQRTRDRQQSTLGNPAPSMTPASGGF